MPTGFAIALPRRLRGPGPAALGTCGQAWRDRAQCAGHHRQRLSRRDQGDPDQSRRRDLRDRARRPHRATGRGAGRRASSSTRSAALDETARGDGGFGSSGSAADGALATKNSNAMPATSCCTEVGGPGQPSSRRRRCWSSAPAASARRCSSISPPPASARSASSTMTRCSLSNLQRQVVHSDGARRRAQDAKRRGRPSPRINPHVKVVAHAGAAHGRQRARHHRRL